MSFRVVPRAVALLALVALPLAGQAPPSNRQSGPSAPPVAARRAPTVPIARALAATQQVDDTVTIAGRATASHGQLQRSALEIAVDDGTAGVRVFSRSLDVPVRAGDSVVVTGSVRPYRGGLELFATTVRVVAGEPRPVRPRALSLATPVTRPMEGRLVSVVGAVTGYGRAEGGEWLRLRGTQASDAGGVTVWVHANHGGGVRLEKVRQADSVRVTGIVVAFQDNPEDPVVWQVVPRTASDVEALGGARWVGSVAWVGGGVVLALSLALLALRLAARRHARALHETEERYRQLLDLSPDAVVVHEAGCIRFANPAAARMFGVLHEKALAGRLLAEFVPEESLPRFGVGEVDVERAAAEGDMVRASGQTGLVVRRSRGQVRPADAAVVDVEVTTSPCRYHDREATIVLARDVTQQLRVERDLRSLALLDELTGLHNRRGFLLFAEQELARARRYGREAALVFADLDGLKAINDAHGHAAGDEALRATANALRSVLRESDVVARWAGDEFVALLLESSAASAPQFDERLRVALELQSLGLPFTVRASVGTAPLEEGITEALEQADAALYRVKGEKR